MNFAETFVLAREMKGLSLEQVAKQSGVSKGCIFQIEKGTTRDPAFSVVAKLAEFYNLRLDRLAERWQP